MRVTIDIDDKDYLDLVWKIFKGVVLMESFPEIKESSGGRGWHLIWRKQNLTMPEVNHYRRVVGDDSNRIFLDSTSPARVPQILFTSKEIIDGEDLDA